MEDPSLFMAIAGMVTETVHGGHQVFLNEEKVQPALDTDTTRIDTTWYLDTGASNHMTGDASVFAELDTGIIGTVRFGDGSVVEIAERGMILFEARKGSHHAMVDVYHIPRLRCNILSIGQLEESGCKILIEDGFCRIWDHQHDLLAKVPRTQNKLYILPLTPAKPVCMAMSYEDGAWH